MPIEEVEPIQKTPEQIAEDMAILAHVITDPQAWIDNAIANNLEWAIQEKIDKYRQDYLTAKYLSITVDEETGEETRVPNPDYKNRVERDTPPPLTEEQIATKALQELDRSQAAVQEAGMTCSNGIKLQVREVDLNRWTQLVATITAFQPETVTRRDYDTQNHTVTTAEALQMMGEVAVWGQWFLSDTWIKKDAIING